MKAKRSLMISTVVTAIFTFFSVFTVTDSAAISQGSPGLYVIKQDTSFKALALTFDDGPHPLQTPGLLEELKKLDVKASFFLVGKLVIRHPEIAESIREEGHTICNHSYNHMNLERLDYSEVLFEWQACRDVIEEVTGIVPKFCRPPGGNYNISVLKAARKAGCLPVFWNINSHDCSHITSERIIQNVISKIEPGSVILLHDGYESTLRALPEIVMRAKQQGYSFVTLEQMFRHSR